MRRLILAILLLAGCEGPEGPMGPEGPGGPGTRHISTTIIGSDGFAAIHLPAAVGSTANPPAVTCYTADSFSSDVWLIIAMDDVFATCGIVQHGVHLDARIASGNPGWYFRVAVVY